METLHVKATRATPEILFDANRQCFRIEGRSIPADAVAFYSSLDAWVTDYLKEFTGSSLTIDIKLDHLNTGSVRSLLTVLAKLVKKQTEGVNVMINWHHDVEDEDMIDKGEEMSLILEHPFRFVPFRDED